MPDELRLSVERGGHLTWTAAKDAQQRATLCSAAWGLSVAFGGDWVRMQDYLPGLHLDIGAIGIIEHRLSMRQQDLGWDRVEHMLWSEIQKPAQRKTVEYVNWNLRCVMHHGPATHDDSDRIAFTVQCQWPGVLGGHGSNG